MRLLVSILAWLLRAVFASRRFLAMHALQRLVQGRRVLVDDRSRLINRLTYVLKEYFPQVVRWFRDKHTDVFVEFVTRWPTLDAAKRAHRDTLIDFFHTHNVRHGKTTERRLDAIKAARPLTLDIAVIEPNQLMAKALLAQIADMSNAIRTFDDAIAARAAEPPQRRRERALSGDHFRGSLLHFGKPQSHFDKNTLSVPWSMTAARSGAPSPLKSPTAKAVRSPVAANLSGVLKLPSP